MTLRTTLKQCHGNHGPGVTHGALEGNNPATGLCWTVGSAVYPHAFATALVNDSNKHPAKSGNESVKGSVGFKSQVKLMHRRQENLRRAAQATLTVEEESPATVLATSRRSCASECDCCPGLCSDSATDRSLVCLSPINTS